MAKPITLTDEYVYRMAPDGKSVQAAEGLLRKGAFSRPKRSAGGSFLEALCKGSEPKPYSVSVDLADPDHPRTGCNCLSMKHPCKHALGLILLALRCPEAFAEEAHLKKSSSKKRKSPLLGATPRKSAEVEDIPPADLNEALFQSILADPQDDGPRLIHADWLDENDQPERAEFIRLQIGLAGLDPDDPRCKTLQAREKKLWNAHKQEWSEGLPAHLRKRDIRFHRGFFEELAGPPQSWCKHCDKLFARHPIYRVRLTGSVGTHDAGLMAVLPHLARVRVLDLSGCKFHEPQKTLQILFGSPFLSGLRRLDLGRSEISSREMAIVANSPALESVIELDLSDNNIGLKGAEALVESSRVGSLRELSLAGNPLGDAGAKALARTPHLTSLTRLDLTGVTLGESARSALRERFGERVVLG